MKTNQILTALLLFIALLLAGCGAKETAPLAVPEGAQAGNLVGLQDCENQPSGSKAKYAAECGTLVVPENWDKADSRLIALPVVRFIASEANPAEPIIFLGGGPGDSNILSAPSSEVLNPIGKAWPVELIRKDLREFQETDVEMLLVNGNLDFAVPPVVLDEAKPYFHKAQIVLLSEFSHTGDVFVLQSEAIVRLITSYYDTGVADTSLFVYQPLSFEPKMSLTTVARLLVTAMIALPALVIWGVVSVVRRVRRRRTANQ